MTKRLPVVAGLLSRAPDPWDGSQADLREYGSLTLTATVAPNTARTFQWSPRGGADENDWFDWKLSPKDGASYSSSISSRGVFNGQAGGFVRLKPNAGSGGTFYLGAGS